ncbi:hypothetical protein BC937DRAFT_93795 [Endogone sp. FLAS-F59071]|nr:hypothetical protein BC937DRAFT_93795 [Endogone sp. FLAS-F59071]|eukprot:RUS14454.1 hypothetical protein BC937DRAFT_93795 [Endogone sp. FLAS-F59071]
MTAFDPKWIPLFQKTINNVIYFTPKPEHDGPDPPLVEINADTIESLPSTKFYFLNCKDKTFNVDARCGKIMIGKYYTSRYHEYTATNIQLQIIKQFELIHSPPIRNPENCTDCIFQFNGRITTHIIEAWSSRGLRLEIGSSVETIQLDNIENVEITVPNPKHFGAVVHSHASGTKVKIGDIEPFEVPAISDDKPHSQYVVRMVNGSLVNEFMERCGIFPIYGTKKDSPTKKTEGDAHVSNAPLPNVK